MPEEARPAFDISTDWITVHVPRGRFTDTVISGWRITAREGSSAGGLHVRPWTEGEIAEYDRRLALHNRWGRRLAWLHRRWDEPVRLRDNTLDGEPIADTKITWKVRFADWLDARFAVRPPPHDSLVLRDSYFNVPGGAVRAVGDRG